MTFKRCDGSDGVHCVSGSDGVELWSPELGVKDIRTGECSFVGVDLHLEYASGGDSLNRYKPDRALAGGLGSRDFGGGFGLGDTGGRGSCTSLSDRRDSGSQRECRDCLEDSRLLVGKWESFSDEIGSGSNGEDCRCSGNRDESEPVCNGVDWQTLGNKVDSKEPVGDTVNVDLREMDGEGERRSSGIGGLA